MIVHSDLYSVNEFVASIEMYYVENPIIGHVLCLWYKKATSLYEFGRTIAIGTQTISLPAVLSGLWNLGEKYSGFNCTAFLL